MPIRMSRPASAYPSPAFRLNRLESRRRITCATLWSRVRLGTAVAALSVVPCRAAVRPGQPS
jgi:hypothetical protein